MDFAVVIPAYRPSPGLIDLVRDLAASPAIPLILIVDDGSGPDFRPIFDEAAREFKVTVLRHAVNLGKGDALKTGINHALCERPDLIGVVTADADGQHHPADIERVAAALLQNPAALIMGSRTFDAAVPLRSRFGNILTRRLMHALTGSNLADTQTGLRGIPAALFPALLRIEARGYEFELEMLIAARQAGTPIAEIPIRTIYEPGNKSSHFNPLVDSMKIYFVLVRFSSVSLISAALDNLIFYLIWKRTGQILEAQVVARAVAVVFNYLMVRKTVFASRESHLKVLPKYLTLVAASATASYFGITYLTGHWHAPAMPAKIMVESLLFFVNFLVQRLAIFPRTQSEGPPRFNARLILAILAAAIAVEVYGFSHANLFAQEIWSAEGRDKLLQFTALYAAFGTAVLILAPWLFAGLVAGALLALTLVLLPKAVLAVALFLLSSWSLGAWLLPTGKPGDRLHQTLLGIAVYIFPMPFVARLPVNYFWVHVAVLAVPVALNFRNLLRIRIPLPDLRPWSERAAFALLAFVFITHWFAMLKPEYGADGLAMHLAVPMNIAYHHVLTYQPSRLLWAVMPMGSDFTNAIVYMLGGEHAPRLLNLLLLAALLGLIYRTARLWVSPAAAWLVAALFATTPMVQFVTGQLLVENLLAALLLAALTAIWRYGEEGDRRWLWAAAALGGSAMSVKLGAVTFLVFALFCAAIEWRRQSKPGRTAAAAAVAVVILLAAAAPPYAIAWAKTGNPVFPFLNHRFHSPLLPPGFDFQDQRFRQPLTWQTPYSLTFYTSRHYEGQNGSFGFQYLWLAPLGIAALLVLQRRVAIGATVVALGGMLAILQSEPNARYLYPELPLLSIPFAALLGWSRSHYRLMHRALIVAAVAAAAINIYFLPSSSYYHKDLYGPFTSQQREAYLADAAPERLVIRWLSRTHPNAPVLLTQDTFIAGLTGEVYENSWQQIQTFQRLLQVPDAPGMRALLESWGVRYLIARKPSFRDTLRPAALADLLTACTVPEFAAGDTYAARLEPACGQPAAAPARAQIVAGRGRWDDFEPAILYRPDWSHSRDFGDAFSHTLSYTDQPGAEAYFAFEGSTLIWSFTKAANRGVASVTIDGADSGTLDQYSADTQWQSRVTFRDLPGGRHLAVIRVTGRRNPASQGAFIDIDCLEVK